MNFAPYIFFVSIIDRRLLKTCSKNSIRMTDKTRTLLDNIAITRRGSGGNFRGSGISRGFLGGGSVKFYGGGGNSRSFLGGGSGRFCRGSGIFRGKA